MKNFHRISKNDLIVLVEPEPSDGGRLGGQKSFDIYTSYRLTARGINYLGAAAKIAGFSNIRYIDQYHDINSSESIDLLERAKVIGVSTITRTAPQSIRLLDKYEDKIRIVGGFDATFRPEDYAKHCDVVVVGEGEKTFPELLLTLAGERGNLHDVEGIAFNDKSGFYQTKKRNLLTPEEMSIIHPDYDDATLSGIRTFPIEDSRGCPKDCNFCTVTKAYGRSFRNKTKEWVVEELRRANGYGKFRFFTGDNFIGNPARAKSVLELIIESGANDHPGIIQSTIQLADDPELMNLLMKAGIRAVCLGIESIDDDILKGMKKRYSGERVRQAVKTIRENGFWVHGMFIAGEDNDSPEKLKELIKWAPENVDSAQLFVLIPLPGSDVAKKMQEENRLLYPKGMEHYHLYEGDHVLFKPSKFKNPLQLQQMHYDFYENFYSWRSGIKRIFRADTRTHAKIAAGLLMYTRLHGKKVLYSNQSKKHIHFLEGLI